MALAAALTIRAKIIIGFACLTIIAGLIGGIGYLGISTLSSNLKFVVGPAWDTADGAMETTIGIEGQMIAVAAILSGEESSENRKSLEESRSVSMEAFSRLKAANLLSQSEIKAAADATTQYENEMMQLLEEHAAYRQAYDRFDKLTLEFVALGEQIEEIGDKEMEAIESAPDAMHRWKGDLDSRWAAADGGMEANIGLLWSLYYLQKLLAAKQPAEIQKYESEISNALSFQEEAADEMLATGKFDDDAGERWGSLGYADAYRQQFASFRAGMADVIALKKSYLSVHTRYRDSAELLLDALEIMEESGDSTVEETTISVASLEAQTKNFLIGAVVAGIIASLVFAFLILRSVLSPIDRVLQRLNDIASGDGDLTQRIELKSKDEMGRLALAFNAFIERLHAMVSEVQGVSEHISQASNVMENSMGSASTKVAEQREQTDTIASAFNELSASAKEISSNTQSASQAAQDAQQKNTKIIGTVNTTISSITHLADDVANAASVVSDLEKDIAQIVNVVSVIGGIAEQTNLLALNAAIESARAGEQGRGFAVVADEVRALAQKTQDSTKQIQDMINGLLSSSANAVEVMKASQEAGQTTAEQSRSISVSLSEISALIDDINDQSQQIATSTEQQTAVSDEMNNNVFRISTLAEDANTEMGAVTEMCRELASKSQKLNTLVNRFKI